MGDCYCHEGSSPCGECWETRCRCTRPTGKVVSEAEAEALLVKWAEEDRLDRIVDEVSDAQ